MVSDEQMLRICRARIKALEAALDVSIAELNMTANRLADVLQVPFVMALCTSLDMDERERQHWLEGREQYLEKYVE